MTLTGGTDQAVASRCVAVERLAELLAQDRDLVLVDVRRPEEWLSYRAPHLRACIPYEEITDRHAELAVTHETPVYLICRSGRRSGIAASALAQIGYRQAYNVTGGMKAWIAAGLPVESGPLPG